MSVITMRIIPAADEAIMNSAELNKTAKADDVTYKRYRIISNQNNDT